MQTKRFIAADMTRALSMVRDELGDDAMILSTQRTSKGVEIIATKDDVNSDAQIPSRQPASRKTAPHDNGQRTQADTAYAYGQASNNTKVGLASGKTQAELAEEMEFARRKMLAMQSNLTLGEWAKQESPAVQQQMRSVNQNVANIDTTSQTSPSYTNTQQSINSAVNDSTAKADREIARLHEEILSMRSAFENQLAAMSVTQERQYQEQQQVQALIPVAAKIKQKLSHLGLNEMCRDRLIRSLRTVDDDDMDETTLWKESLARLSRMIPSMADDPVARGGVYAFLGTTGVGKTTTIAKLAARYVIEHGADKVALLTTDTFRIGAHDQLRSLGRILNVQVKVIDDLDHIPAILSQFSRQTLVLIDTPGMRFNDPLLNKHLSALKRCRHLQTALVLSANSQYQMMQASLHNYRVANPRFCVMTKLDECASLGDALSLLAGNDLPLAYTTDGQAVPDDLSILKPHQLVAKAIGLSQIQLPARTKKKPA